MKALILIAGLALVAIWVYVSYCQYVIAKKLNTPHPWLAWIPIVQSVYVMVMAKFQWWLIVIVVIAALIGGSNDSFGLLNLIAIIGMVYAYMRISEFRHRPKWWGILMIIPLVNLYIIYQLAFEEADHSPAVVDSPTNTEA